MNTVKNAMPDVARKYWTTLGIVLTIGFAINYFMVTTIPAESLLAIHPIALLIGYFVCCFAGIYLSKTSDNPAVSFLGYLMVVVPVGIVIVPFVQQHDPMIVEKAVLFTAILSGGMALAGAVYPSFFKSIGGILFWALLISIISEIIMLIIGYDLAIIDWIVAIIFLGFIGYDYAMALEDEPTVDAAVDRAVSLYVDILICLLVFLLY